MTDPQVFSRIEADRVLKRAAEIEGSEDARPLTVDELRSIAGEAGFGPGAVERAIAEIRASGTRDVHRPPVQQWGLLVTRLSAIRKIPVGIDSEQLMQAVRLFQPYRDGPAQVKLEEREITWRDRKGIQFTLVSVGEVTELRVFVSKFMLIRRGRWREWVKAATDRLEALILMVAERGRSLDGAAPPAPRIRPPATDRDG